MKHLSTLITILLTAASIKPALAHISYTNRNLGTFSISGGNVTASNYNGSLSTNGTSATVTITNQNVATDYGWAAGTSPRFGDSHELRAFRFTLIDPAIVSLQIDGLMYSAGALTFSPLQYPAYSLFQGLSHLPPNALDHDQSAISVAWLTSLVGTGNFNGAFNALGDWKIGSDDGTTFSDLSSFTYYGNAADGSSANFGSATGIQGDGNANGSVFSTFYLPAGNFTVFVGGGLSGGNSSSSYGLQASITVVPEPSSWSLLAIGVCIVAVACNRRRLMRS